MKETDQALARVGELFAHDGSGNLVWLKKPRARSNRVKIGALAGAIASNGYRYVGFDRQSFLAHRVVFALVYGRWPIGNVDHANGDALDNRPSNLRECTQAQNAANSCRPRNNTSGLKGVSFSKERGRFRASIKANGIARHIGWFFTADEAHRAYMAESVRLNGEFARAA